MRVVSNRRLVDFSLKHGDATESLQVWRRLMETNAIPHFAAMRQLFGSVDIIDDKHIFDIRGNHFRLIAGVSYTTQICYVRNILTHLQYDKGNWK